MIIMTIHTKQLPIHEFNAVVTNLTNGFNKPL